MVPNKPGIPTALAQTSPSFSHLYHALSLKIRRSPEFWIRFQHLFKCQRRDCLDLYGGMCAVRVSALLGYLRCNATVCLWNSLWVCLWISLWVCLWVSLWKYLIRTKTLKLMKIMFIYQLHLIIWICPFSFQEKVLQSDHIYIWWMSFHQGIIFAWMKKPVYFIGFFVKIFIVFTDNDCLWNLNAF